MNRIEKINNIAIDEQKVKRIMLKLIMEEKRNIKTKENSENQMVKVIKKIIKEEVQCY